MENKKLIDWGMAIWKAIVKKAEEIRSDNNTVVLIVCLLVSTLFWFLKALNDEYRTEVEFPIEFTDIPKNYSLYGAPPEKLVATIEDAGFTIIRYRFSYVFSSLKFDVSKYFNDKKPDATDGTISLEQTALKKGIEQALITTTKIISIYPENVSISYSKLQERLLPIKVLAEITTEQQHIVNGNISTIPDSVLVIGSGVQLDQTEAIYTQPVRAQNLEDSIVRNIALQSVDGLDFDTKRVKLTIPVEMYTEKILEVPIIGRGFPDSLEIRTFPGVAKVSCICGLSVYSQVFSHNFVCYVNYNQVEDRSTGNTEVSVESSSDYAKRVMLRTKSVDYLIEKKN